MCAERGHKFLILLTLCIKISGFPELSLPLKCKHVWSRHCQHPYNISQGLYHRECWPDLPMHWAFSGTRSLLDRRPCGWWQARSFRELNFPQAPEQPSTNGRCELVKQQLLRWDNSGDCCVDSRVSSGLKLQLALLLFGFKMFSSWDFPGGPVGK